MKGAQPGVRIVVVHVPLGRVPAVKPVLPVAHLRLVQVKVVVVLGLPHLEPGKVRAEARRLLEHHSVVVVLQRREPLLFHAEHGLGVEGRHAVHVMVAVLLFDRLRRVLVLVVGREGQLGGQPVLAVVAVPVLAAGWRARLPVAAAPAAHFSHHADDVSAGEAADAAGRRVSAVVCAGVAARSRIHLRLLARLLLRHVVEVLVVALVAIGNRVHGQQFRLLGLGQRQGELGQGDVGRLGVGAGVLRRQGHVTLHLLPLDLLLALVAPDPRRDVELVSVVGVGQQRR